MGWAAAETAVGMLQAQHPGTNGRALLRGEWHGKQIEGRDNEECECKAGGVVGCVCRREIAGEAALPVLDMPWLVEGRHGAGRRVQLSTLSSLVA